MGAYLGFVLESMHVVPPLEGTLLRLKPVVQSLSDAIRVSMMLWDHEWRDEKFRVGFGEL